MIAKKQAVVMIALGVFFAVVGVWFTLTATSTPTRLLCGAMAAVNVALAIVNAITLWRLVRMSS